MSSQEKLARIRELQIDSLIGSVYLTSSGGHPPDNELIAAFEVLRQLHEDRLKAQIALEARQQL